MINLILIKNLNHLPRKQLLTSYHQFRIINSFNKPLEKDEKSTNPDYQPIDSSIKDDDNFYSQSNNHFITNNRSFNDSVKLKRYE